MRNFCRKMCTNSCITVIVIPLYQLPGAIPLVHKKKLFEQFSDF